MAKPKALTVAKVKQIRVWKKKGWPLVDIALKSKVSVSTILDAVNKRGAYARV